MSLSSSSSTTTKSLIIIHDLSSSIDKSVLLRIFDKFGNLKNIEINKGKRIANIEYVNSNEAYRAYKRAQEVELNGKKLNVEFIKKNKPSSPPPPPQLSSRRIKSPSNGRHHRSPPSPPQHHVIRSPKRYGHRGGRRSNSRHYSPPPPPSASYHQNYYQQQQYSSEHYHQQQQQYYRQQNSNYYNQGVGGQHMQPPRDYKRDYERSYNDHRHLFIHMSPDAIVIIVHHSNDDRIHQIDVIVQNQIIINEVEVKVMTNRQHVISDNNNKKSIIIVVKIKAHRRLSSH